MADTNFNEDRLRAQRVIAEEQRNAALLAADIEARRRVAAEVNALDASVVANAAENDAISARIAADQANFNAAHLATERNVLREEVEVNRQAAANSNFGIMLIACVSVAALIAIGIWYFSSVNGTTSAGTTPAVTSASATDSATPPPVTVHVAPAPVVVVPTATSHAATHRRSHVAKRHIPVQTGTSVNSVPTTSTNSVDRSTSGTDTSSSDTNSDGATNSDNSSGSDGAKNSDGTSSGTDSSKSNDGSTKGNNGSTTGSGNNNP